MRSPAYVVALIAMLPSAVLAQSAYVCVTEKATGFRFDKQTSTWDVTGFKGTQQYLVKRSTEKGVAWSVSLVGQKFPIAQCEDDFNKQGFLYCRGFQEFRMNKENLRFLTAYLLGYVTDATGGYALGPEGSNTPSIELGKCSPL